VARLERASHNVHITRAVESVIAPTIRHLHQPRLDVLALLEILRRVDKVRRAELLRPLLLAIVDIHYNDLACALRDRTLDDTQTYTSSAEDCNIRALLDTALTGCDDGRAVAGRDTAAEQAGAVHGCLVGNGDTADVRDDGVLGESAGAHEVEEVFALALEARCAVGHHTLALCGADFAAEVRLAGEAELAFLAFRCAGTPCQH